MRRAVVAFLTLVLLAAAPAAEAASWAQTQIRTVVAAGLMGPSVELFRPQAPLTRRELGEALAVLTRTQQVVVDPNRAVTVRELDGALVRALGLAPAAVQFRSKVGAAGLRPPSRIGTETVARLLRLRFNHPAAADGLELRPFDPVTRAETAYSLARVLQLSQWDVDNVNRLAASFSLPVYTEWQKRVLTRSVRFVGWPYVWGGIWEFPHTPLGVPTRGGFDCSGLAWRIYKLEPYTGGGSLQDTLSGRTTYAMSGEVPRSWRIARTSLRPADLIFFGDLGWRSAPSQIGHMGIYIGHGWFVHSSSQGVTLVPLSGWYAERFAWGRRPLREAGLT
jgi:cell wall-associated NlpC family hydrolase